ncbi:MAG: type VII secretion protein EssC [Clostridia bacterium]|nr:type VII secretion protein EssC [Clostridia bacterium]
MKVYLYDPACGLTVTFLPEEKEGQLTLYCTGENGRKTRLFDIEGNGSEWVMYATLRGRMYADGVAQTEAVLSDGLALQVECDGRNAFLRCMDEEGEKNLSVKFFRFPVSGKLCIGSENADILLSHPWMGRQQAIVEKAGDRLCLRAMEGGCGTYLNDAPVYGESPVECGDKLDLWGLRILFLEDSFAVCSLGEDVLYGPGLVAPPKTEEDTSRHSLNVHMLPERHREYARTPRIATPEDDLKLDVDPPPSPQSKEDMPLIYSVGSSAFMSISSVMMAMNTVTNAQAMGTPLRNVMPSVLMAGGMFVGSLLMPVLTRRYSERRSDALEQKRQEKYVAYLQGIDRKLTESGARQKAHRTALYPAPDALWKETARDQGQIWNRMPFHSDFLTLRLGTASLPVRADVHFPRHTFTLEEDRMREEMERLENKTYQEPGMPLLLSLRDTGILGIIGEERERMRFLQGLLLQMGTYHSYRELKLVFVYDAAETEKWEFVRWLPHVWNDTREFRAIGTSPEAMRPLSAYIDALCPMDDQETKHESMCVVIVSDMTLCERCPALVERMAHIQRSSLRVLALAGEANALPKECTSVVVLEGEKGVLNEDIEKMSAPVLFSLDPVPESCMRDFAGRLCNTHLREGQAEGRLVDQLTFFDMLRCGNVEQINAPERWRNANPVKTLAAPVGIDRYGALLTLDIHQNAHGPHGLIAGMTGSGKSEFIITYLLSMAVNYSPLEVGFILIDYKGGGMSDTLARLPHVVGIIDNLAGSQGIHRSLVSIKSEILRRQMVFKEISEKKHVSNMDIYKYQAMYRNGEIAEPMQHLILVSDEFAELKEQESAFMDDIVSMARIGRSLGVHLILATQKPTGVISPQIASNARFHVSLKVQDKSDSMEILGRPDAALLSRTGRFYLQVGFNEVFTLGQSAWSGAVLNPKPRYVEEPDLSFEILDDLGETLMQARPAGKITPGTQQKQVDALVQYLRASAEAHDLMPQKSWMPPLPAEILLEDIEKTYAPVFTPYALDPVIGVVDDPGHQTQFPLQLNFTTQGNAIVYGFAGSGKQQVVEAVVWSLGCHHTADEVQIYCLDFASEASRMFSPMPQVGDVMVGGEDEKIGNFVRMLENEMENRRKLLASFGGSLDAYRREHAEPMPGILVVLENYPAFAEMYEELEEHMYRLIREGTRFGLYFLVTALSGTSVRYRLLQNFKQVLCLQMMDRMDYSNLLGQTDGVVPMERPGSGLCRRGGVLAFQTGAICPLSEEDRFRRIQERARAMRNAWHGHVAGKVPVLPEHVTIHDLTDAPENISMDAVPVGIDKTQMTPLSLRMTDQFLWPVLYSVLPEVPYFPMLGDMLAMHPSRQVYMLDADGTLAHPRHPGYTLCTQLTDVIRVIDVIYQETVRRHNAIHMAKQTGEDIPSYPDLILMIVDPKSLFEKLKESDLATGQLQAVLLKGRTDMQMQVLFLQEARHMSALSMQSWYSRLPNRDGIWLGDGLSMQSVLRADQISRDRLPGEAFGYVVVRGKARMMKLLEGRGE